MKKLSIITTFLKWIMAAVGAAIIFYFGYNIYRGFNLFSLPTKQDRKRPITVTQLQREYVESKSNGRTGLDGLVNNDLTILEMGYLYLQTLNPFRRVPDSRK